MCVILLISTVSCKNNIQYSLKRIKHTAMSLFRVIISQVHVPFPGADPGFGVGGTKFGKVIWEYYYYCLRCLWNIWCRKIKIDLQVIMIIWGEETEPLFSVSLCFLSSPFIFLCLFGVFCFFRGGAPLWICQWFL